MTDAAERALAVARVAWGEHWTPAIRSRAPGRLELLGNHVDYNGGPVLAAAIDRDVVCLAALSDGPGIRVLMADFATEPLLLDPRRLRGWRHAESRIEPFDYARGVIATGNQRDGTVRSGIQVVVAGDVPVGFGLSSSAALCVALTLVLHEGPPRGRDLVLRAQEAEHRAGTPCGTMDQSASVGGHVILYDGATVTWDVVAPELGDYVFAVADSGVARSLGASSYPRRVRESQDALEVANRSLRLDHTSLAQITGDELAQLEDVLSDTLWRRVRHVVSETARVREGVKVMREGDWQHFGWLMSESGASSAGDYEISHPRVEQIVAIAKGVPGVAGARMMGGGEGGTALVLCKRDAVSRLIDSLERTYYREHPLDNHEPVRLFRFAPGASVSVG